MQQESTALFELQLDHEGTGYLTQAAKWGRFLSIVGFIMVGLLIIFSFFAVSIIAAFQGYGRGGADNTGMAALGGVVTFFYIAIALLWLMPVLYLYRFSTKMLAALRTHDQVLINQSFKNLKSCFRFMGIMTIIVLSFYALALVIGIGAGIFAAASS